MADDSKQAGKIKANKIVANCGLIIAVNLKTD